MGGKAQLIRWRSPSCPFPTSPLSSAPASPIPASGPQVHASTALSLSHIPLIRHCHCHFPSFPSLPPPPQPALHRTCLSHNHKSTAISAPLHRNSPTHSAAALLTYSAPASPMPTSAPRILFPALVVHCSHPRAVPSLPTPYPLPSSPFFSHPSSAVPTAPSLTSGPRICFRMLRTAPASPALVPAPKSPPPLLNQAEAADLAEVGYRHWRCKRHWRQQWQLRGAWRGGWEEGRRGGERGLLMGLVGS
ncbi:unnamed protein product [Closterium sp. Naga37s-1]|nr:unnamed protein product [Closterium sp. Naga37s-1]